MKQASCKILRVTSLALFSVFLLACSLGTFEDKIVGKIEAECKSSPCVIRISDLTNFDWDKMYVFYYGEDIEPILGVSIPEETRFTRKIVFTKEGNVVHYEELPTDIEAMVNNQVNFVDADGNYRHSVYSFDSAVFEAKKYSGGSGIFYQLDQKMSEQK